jgi:hypothetical protein
LHQRPVFLDDVEAELDVVGAVAGEGVEADFDELDAPGLFRDGLFFDFFDDRPNKMNFVHNPISVSANWRNCCPFVTHKATSYWQAGTP